MVRLICIDVDGTLVGSSGTVLPAIWSAVERVRSAGIRLALCSGRPAFGITRDYAARLDPQGWHVFQNGASVLHLSSGESRSSRIADATVALLIERARRTGRTLELYTDKEYAVESSSERARAHARLLGVPFTPRPFDSLTGAIVRAQWVVGLEEEAVLREPHPELTVSSSTSPVMPDTRFINLTPAGVDKASAVLLVAAQYGVPPAEVMMVGDGANDLGALRAVGFPVAMGNAEPEVRAATRARVGHVDEAGLAEALLLALPAG